MPVALITGGATRVGRSIALTVASCGYDIIVHYHSSHEDAVSLCDKIIKVYRVKCFLAQCDLSNHECMLSFCDDVFYKHNPSLLVNNASIFARCKFIDTTYDELMSNVSLNFLAPFFLTQFLVKYHQRFDQKRIINILDIMVQKKKTNFFPYLISKKILLEFSEMIAEEYNNIAMNNILPGILFDEDRSTPVLNKVVDTLIDIIRGKYKSGSSITVI